MAELMWKANKTFCQWNNFEPLGNLSGWTSSLKKS